MQLRPALYLPVAATTSNRVRTKILEFVGIKPQKSSELFAYIKKNAYLCTRFEKIRRLYPRKHRKIQGCIGITLGY